MTATLNSCVSKLSNLATNAYQTVSAGLRSTPACYAKESVIRAERITAVSLIGDMIESCV